MTVGADRAGHDVGQTTIASSRPSRATSRRATSRSSLDALIGLVLLPFNVHHLGPVGLRPLDADRVDDHLLLGPRPRVRRLDREVRRAVPRASATCSGLNDIASTLFVIFSVIGVVAYGDLRAARAQHRPRLQPDAGPGVDRPLADADHRRLRVARASRSASSAASSTASSATT